MKKTNFITVGSRFHKSDKRKFSYKTLFRFLFTLVYVGVMWPFTLNFFQEIFSNNYSGSMWGLGNVTSLYVALIPYFFFIL